MEIIFIIIRDFFVELWLVFITHQTDDVTL